MVLVCVEFDGKPLRRPVGVKLVSSGDEVHRRLRQFLASAHCEEESLEIGAREAGDAVDDQGLTKPGDPTESLTARKQVVDCGKVQQAQAVRVLHRLADEPGVNGSEVEKGARDGRRGDPLCRGDVLRLESRGAVDPYLHPGLPPGRRGDLDRARESGRQAPKPGSRAVTEQGSRLRAATQNRGNAFAVPRNAPVPDRIDPSVQRVDPPGVPSMPNSVPGITKPLHLPKRHHSVLPLSKPGQPMVRSSFCVHMDY